MKRRSVTLLSPSRAIKWLILSSFLLLIAGCASTRKPGAQLPSELPDFPDVPIPAGFTKDPKASFLVETQAFRTGILTYRGKGKAKTADLVEFFKENLHPMGWRLLANFQGPRTVMVFLKEQQTCLITISQGWRESRLEVRVGTVIETIPVKQPGPPETSTLPAGKP